MKYTRKTKDFYYIMGYTGSQYGWEEMTVEEKYSEAKQRLREYRENQPEYSYKIVMKREKIQPLTK